MFIISLLLIGLIAATLIVEQKSAIAEQESVAIPIRSEDR